MERRQRIKTDVVSVVAQLQRQKSIYKNLSWQIRQRDKKINFLERYFNDLQRVIHIEQEKDDTLKKKADQNNRKKLQSYVYRYPTQMEKQQNSYLQKKRIVTQVTYHDYTMTPSRSVIIKSSEQ